MKSFLKVLLDILSFGLLNVIRAIVRKSNRKKIKIDLDRDGKEDVTIFLHNPENDLSDQDSQKGD